MSEALPTSAIHVAQLFDAEMQAQSDRAMARTDWTAGPAVERELAALVYRAAYAAGFLSTSPPAWDDEAGCVVIDADAPGVDDEHEWVIRSIYDAIGAWVPSGAVAPEFAIASYPKPAEAGYAAGVLIGIGVLAVIGASIQALTVCYVTERVAEVAAVGLAGAAQSGQLAQHIAGVTQIVEQHAAAEARAGQPLPMSEVEKTAIESMTATARIVAERRPPEVTTPIGTSAGQVGAATARAVDSLSTWLPWVALAGVGVWLMKDKI